VQPLLEECVQYVIAERHSVPKWPQSHSCDKSKLKDLAGKWGLLPHFGLSQRVSRANWATHLDSVFSFSGLLPIVDFESITACSLHICPTAVSPVPAYLTCVQISPTPMPLGAAHSHSSPCTSFVHIIQSSSFISADQGLKLLKTYCSQERNQS
jgi:hypothetical protein